MRRLCAFLLTFCLTAPLVKPLHVSAEASIFQTFELTDEELQKIANLCCHEQPSGAGVAAEASLMANLYEFKGITGKSIYEYARYCGWWANSQAHMDEMWATAEDVENVRKVLCEGKRTVPAYVIEHDYLGDIECVTNNGTVIDKTDPSQYIPFVSQIKQSDSHFGTGITYIYYCHPCKGSDPFGYISESMRSSLGESYYEYGTWELCDGSKYALPEAPAMRISFGKMYMPVVLSWDACDNADYYGVHIYNSDGTQVRNLEPYYGTSYEIPLPPGNYSAEITAVNANGTAVSNNMRFTVVSGTIAPTVTMNYNGHLYSVYDSGMWYTQSETLAQQFGGHLVTINSKGENDFIKSLIANGKQQAYWTGGTDIRQKGVFSWVTGEDMTFTNWAAGQPDDSGQNQDYMEITKDGLWNDSVNESTVNGFVLEIEPLTAAASAVYRSSVYQLFDTPMTWTDAKAYCNMLGGHLVYIGSAGEDNAVTALAKQGKLDSYWLGGLRRSGGFEWINYTPLSYENWNTQQPDNSGGIENFMSLNKTAGKWHDNKNTACGGFICEFDDANDVIVPDTLTMEIGETFSVGMHEHKLSFQSHQTSVAAVSNNGIITANTTGKAVILILDERNNILQMTVNVIQKHLPGDCTGNGTADAEDVQLLQTWLLADTDYDLPAWKAADLNGDGMLNAVDLSLMKQAALA